jgi:hypothetical protein
MYYMRFKSLYLWIARAMNVRMWVFEWQSDFWICPQIWTSEMKCQFITDLYLLPFLMIHWLGGQPGSKEIRRWPQNKILNATSHLNENVAYINHSMLQCKHLNLYFIWPHELNKVLNKLWYKSVTNTISVTADVLDEVSNPLVSKNAFQLSDFI